MSTVTTSISLLKGNRTRYQNLLEKELGKAKHLLEDDREEDAGKVCKSKVKKHGCSANAGVHSYECPVPNVDNILYATVHQLAAHPQGIKCKEAPFPLKPNAKDAFTWKGNTIYMGENCRAVFQVVYETCVEEPVLECTRDSIKRHGCTANAGEQSYKCRVPIVGDILYATVFNAVAGHICNPATYPLAADAKDSYAWDKNYIYTTTDCRAVFDVYFDVCETVVGTCSIKGDPHITTLDGYAAKFHGEVPCDYNLAYQGQFKITGTFTQCNGPRSSCLVAVQITFQGDSWNLDQNYAVYKNGAPVTVPFNSPQTTVTKKGNMIELALSNDFIVRYNGATNAEILVPDTLMGKMNGLCGDYDGDAKNDKGITTNPNFYKVDPSCQVP